MTLDTAPAVMKCAEVAQLLRCDIKSVYAEINAGHLQAVRLGRSYRVTRAALHRFLNTDLEGIEEPPQ